MKNVKHFDTLTPIKAIRMKCMQCSNGQYSEIRKCPIPGCALYHYRLGHRPDKETITDIDLRIFPDDKREVVHFTCE